MSDLWDINSEWQDIKSHLHEKKSEFWVCLSEMEFFFSQNCEKQSQNCKIAITLFFIIFSFRGRNRIHSKWNSSLNLKFEFQFEFIEM